MPQAYAPCFECNQNILLTEIAGGPIRSSPAITIWGNYFFGVSLRLGGVRGAVEAPGVAEGVAGEEVAGA